MSMSLKDIFQAWKLLTAPTPLQWAWADIEDDDDLPPLPLYE